MDDQSWKLFTCPTDFDCLVKLLDEKSEEFNIKGHLDVLTKMEAKEITRSVVEANGSLEDVTMRTGDPLLVHSKTKSTAALPSQVVNKVFLIFVFVLQL